MTSTPKPKLKLSSIKVDVKAEREGDWVPYPMWEGARFKVKSVYSPDYQAARSLLLSKFATKYGDEPIPADEIGRGMGKLFADLILLDWDGIDEAYAQERASEMLPEPDWRRLLDAVRYCAERVGTREAEFIKDAVKN